MNTSSVRVCIGMRVGGISLDNFFRTNLKNWIIYDTLGQHYVGKSKFLQGGCKWNWNFLM